MVQILLWGLPTLKYTEKWDPSGALYFATSDITIVKILRIVSLWMFLLSLDFISLYFLHCWMSVQHFITSIDWLYLGGVSPYMGPPNLYYMVLIGWVADRFICLVIFNSCFTVFSIFLFVYGIIQPWRLAPQERDNIHVHLYMMHSGPDNTCYA